MGRKFQGAAIASNGNIIFAPSNADGVGVVDPSTNTFTLVDISNTITIDRKFGGAATAGCCRVLSAAGTGCRVR